MKKQLTLLIALPLFTLSASAQKNYSRAHNRMLDEAKSLYEGGQWLDAAKVYKKLLNVDTTFADVYYEIGMCETNIPGMRERSAAHFEQAARHGNLEAKFQVALARHQQQRFDEELRLLAEYRRGKDRVTPDSEVDRHMMIANTAKELTTFPV